MIVRSPQVTFRYEQIAPRDVAAEVRSSQEATGFNRRPRPSPGVWWSTATFPPLSDHNSIELQALVQAQCLLILPSLRVLLPKLLPRTHRDSRTIALRLRTHCENGKKPTKNGIVLDSRLRVHLNNHHVTVRIAVLRMERWRSPSYQ